MELRRIAAGFENRHAHSRTGEQAPSGRRSGGSAPVQAGELGGRERTLRSPAHARRADARKSIVGVCGSFATANR